MRYVQYNAKAAKTQKMQSWQSLAQTTPEPRDYGALVALAVYIVGVFVLTWAIYG